MEGCVSGSSVGHTVAWCLIRNDTFLRCSRGWGTWDGYLKSLLMPEVKSLLSCKSFEYWAKSHWAEWFTRICRGSFQLYWEMHQWHEKFKCVFSTHKPKVQPSGASWGDFEILEWILPVLAGGVFSSLLSLSLGFWIYDTCCSTSRENESSPGMV